MSSQRDQVIISKESGFPTKGIRSSFKVLFTNYFSGRRGGRHFKSIFFAEANLLTENFEQRNWLNMPKNTCKNLKNFVKLCHFFFTSLFPIVRSKVQILYRFLKILRRHASAWEGGKANADIG